MCNELNLVADRVLSVQSVQCSVMEWTKESALRLIKLYEQKTLLWSAKHPQHFNKIRRNDSWEEIAEKMETDVDECRRKMTGLLSALRREKAKIRKSIVKGKGADEVYESAWFAFKSLQFLWDKEKPLETRSTIPIEEEESGEGEETPDERDIQENNNTSNSDVSLPPSKPASTRKRKHPEYRRLEKSFEILNSCASTSNHDESQDFGNLVAKKLRRYNDLTRCVIENEIMGIFLNADRGFYEQTHYSSLPQSNYPYQIHIPAQNIDIQRFPPSTSP